MGFNNIYKYIVFCDFDGTITIEETFVGMLREFASASYDTVENQLIAGDLNLRDAVRCLVESIPANRHAEVVEYIKDKPIRKGFSDLLIYLQRHRIPFVVVSGGLIDSVSTKLRPYRHLIEDIYAAKTDQHGKYLRVYSDFESRSELVAKTQVMNRYHFEQSIVIGDGITDLRIARVADIVFARGHLASYLKSEGKPHIVWNDFFDVTNHLATLGLAL